MVVVVVPGTDVVVVVGNAVVVVVGSVVVVVVSTVVVVVVVVVGASVVVVLGGWTGLHPVRIKIARVETAIKTFFIISPSTKKSGVSAFAHPQPNT